MSIQRRRFVQSIAAASAASTATAQAPAVAVPAKNTTVAAEAAAEAVARFLTPRQRATLRHAASLLQPAGEFEATIVIAPHDPPPGGSIENAVVLVRGGGGTALFSGDAEVSTAAFGPVVEELKRLAPRGLDHAFMSWWFRTGEAGRGVVDGLLRPRELD